MLPLKLFIRTRFIHKVLHRSQVVRSCFAMQTDTGRSQMWTLSLTLPVTYSTWHTAHSSSPCYPGRTHDQSTNTVCELRGVQCRWQLKWPSRGAKPSSSWYKGAGMEEKPPQLSLSITLLCLRAHSFNIRKSRGMPLGPKGHWSCTSTLPLTCCIGVGGENAKSILLFAEGWSYSFYPQFIWIKRFRSCNFNKSWWYSEHQNQHYHLCQKTYIYSTGCYITNDIKVFGRKKILNAWKCTKQNFFLW